MFLRFGFLIHLIERETSSRVKLPLFLVKISLKFSIGVQFVSAKQKSELYFMAQLINNSNVCGLVGRQHQKETNVPLLF